jgi:hypothetical protein
MSKLVQEPDKINTRLTLTIGLGALFTFVVGGYGALYILHMHEKELLPHGAPVSGSKIGQEEIGIVDQPVFDDFRASRFADAQRARLDEYGWVDEAKGVVHVPIRRAMQMELESGGRK